MSVDPPHTGRPLLYVVFAALLVGLPSAGCTPDCWVADQIELLDTGVTVGGRMHSLVRRISGFQDKIVSYELFLGAPVFDECGRTAADPVAYNSYDPEQGQIRALIFRNGRLDIVYTRDRAEAVSPEKLRLTVE